MPSKPIPALEGVALFLLPFVIVLAGIAVVLAVCTGFAAMGGQSEE